MKKLFLLLLVNTYILSLFSQIIYGSEDIKDLEVYSAGDYYELHDVSVITEVEDGFIYVDHRSKSGENVDAIIKKTNANLQTIDSLTLDDLDVDTEILWFFGINRKSDGTIQLFAHGFPALYVITINESLDVLSIVSAVYKADAYSYRRPIINEDEYIFLLRTLNPDDSFSHYLVKLNTELELLYETQLPYGWSFLEGMTQTTDGLIHIAISTGTISFDETLNMVSGSELEGLSNLEFSCIHQRKTVNLGGSNQFFGGMCWELLYPDFLEDLERERIFKYNDTTQIFHSFFDHAPLGSGYFYTSRLFCFDAAYVDRLYLGNNFYKSFSFPDSEYIFSINSVDSTGNLRWLKLYGSSEFVFLNEVLALEDEGVLLTIEKWFEDEDTNLGHKNVYYLKLDKDGNVDGTTHIPGLVVYDSIIEVFPNPTTEYFTINNTAEWKPNTAIKIINSLGQTMAIHTIEAAWEKPNFDCTDWKKGVYFAQISNDTGLVETKKIIVE